jgi:DNA-directed RNA polymerase subunit RPC12/RpoP
MDIVCAQCNATYHIPDHKLPRQKAAAACKKCGGRIVVAPLGSQAGGPAQAKPAKAAPPPAPPPPKAAAPPAAPACHDPIMLQELPAVVELAPWKFDLGEILTPTRRGRYRTRGNRFKLKILAAVRPVLEKLLRPGEQVLRVAAATAYHPLEIFLGNGVLTMLYNRYALVATNQRLIMINTNHRLTRPAHYLFQMAYAEIRKVSRGLFRTSLALTRKTGRHRVFTSMKTSQSADLRDFITAKLDPPGAAPAMDLKERLCPACYAPLDNGLDQCPTCRAAFKTSRRAALRSLLLPGWGDIYLGHRLLGGLELLGSLAIWGLVLNSLATGERGTVVLAGFLAIYHLLDALLARHMAAKGYSLEKERPVPAPGAQLAAGRL